MSLSDLFLPRFPSLSPGQTGAQLSGPGTPSRGGPLPLRSCRAPSASRSPFSSPRFCSGETWEGGNQGGGWGSIHLSRLPLLDAFAGGQITPAGQPGRTLQEGRPTGKRAIFSPLSRMCPAGPFSSPWPSVLGVGQGSSWALPWSGVSFPSLHQPEVLPDGCLSPCLPCPPAPHDRGPEILTVALRPPTCLPRVLRPRPAELGTWGSPCCRLRCQAVGAWVPQTPWCSWLGIASSGHAPPGTG